ncbi:hypothetical protein LDENG_00146850 [Lucifuga dentata]|nr:hypothetical protein LDENG_00146850 [Lucifuga dentata]
MDLSLLPSSVSEYKQRTGACFTVRSASSPSYSLTCRTGLREPRATSEEENIKKVREREINRIEEQKPFFKQLQTGSNGTNKENHKVTGYQVRNGNHTSLSGQCERMELSDEKTSCQLKNDTVDKTIMESNSDRSVNSNAVPGSWGRTEWRRHNLPSRSRSLDCRGRSNSSDRATKADMLILPSKRGGVISKHDEGLQKIRTGDKDEGTESRLTSTLKAYSIGDRNNVVGERSPVDEQLQGYLHRHQMNQGLERSRGHSLPSRMKDKANSRLGEASASFRPKGGQSIQECIDKLYESTGLSTTEDSSRIKDPSTPVRDWSLYEGQEQATMSHYKGTNTDFLMSSPVSQWNRLPSERAPEGIFSRRFSEEEKNSPRKTFAWMSLTDPSTSVHSSGSVSSVSPHPGGSKERSSRGQWQSQNQGRYEEGGAQWGRRVLGLGTMSLDRDRSKNTVAAQIRSARTTAGISTAYAQPHTLLEEERSLSFRDPTEFRESRASGNKDKGRANRGEEKSGSDETNENLRERNSFSALKMERVKEQEKVKETDDGVKEEKRKKEIELKTSISDDVFESNTQKITLKTAERKKFPEKLPVPFTANVRNKINQFEQLTQRAQVQMPRRAFSVPTQFSTVQFGVRKSASAKAIGGLRDRWEVLKEREETGNKAEEKGIGSDKKIESERVWVRSDNVVEEEKKVQRRLNLVDEVGLRLGNSDLVKKEGGNMGGDKTFDDFGKFSRPKDILQLPLNQGIRKQNFRKFDIDETDFSKATSPEKSSMRDNTGNSTLFLLPSNSSSTSAALLHSPELSDGQKTESSGNPSPVSDNDKTPTINIASSILVHNSPLENTTATEGSENESSSVSTHEVKLPEKHSPLLSLPLTSSSLSNLPDLISPSIITPHLKEEKRGEDLDAWVAALNPKIKGWNDDNTDEDDDEGTEKDEDSSCDSDSAESSVTITSNMSQSDRKSFCVSLADLCNFAGVEYDSENDSDDWASPGRRSASLSSDISALSYVSVLPNEELDKLLEDVRGLGDSNLQDYNDVQVVVLHKEVGVGLGFSLAGGVDQNKPITIHRVFHSGVAAQQGSIREGDQVLSINGTALAGYAHWEVLRILRRAKTREMGVVVLRRAGVSSVSKWGPEADARGQTQTQLPEAGQCVCVHLEKNNRDLGFSLEGGVGSSLGNKPLSIQKIFQGGPVGKVCPGDELIEIQGVNVLGMRRLEAWTLIRTLPPGPVDVVLHRPPKHLET